LSVFLLKLTLKHNFCKFDLHDYQEHFKIYVSNSKKVIRGCS